MTDRFLPTSLRRALERDIKEARRVAEEGAADAIRRLGVGDAKAPAHVQADEDRVAARRRLRAHARALGDNLNPDGTHETVRLVEAAAYAQWHRRLFARFLAERGLLRHPDHGVAVTLEEAEELAAEEGFVDGWSAAESYAARMLPAVFQPEDPVLALTLAPEHAQALRKLVLGIDAETFQADDSLGWTYQFWRALEKARVNKSGGKIGARELPAVTQLFTEPYMVKFLLHNTLGAWRAGKVLAERPELAACAVDEAALRVAVSPPGYDFDMLRFVRDGDEGPWRPAAGTFPDWPATAADIRALDPCCGSGHFLTEMLAILAALRADAEGLSDGQAVATVLSDNLFGLEIDGRCVQIAAFAVALSAWRIGGFQPFGIDQVHIAWVGAPPPLDRIEFEALGNGDAELRYALGCLYDLFRQAPVLGSLLEPTGGDLLGASVMGKLEASLPALVQRTRSAEPERAEGAVAARGMADALAVLGERYTLVVTNVPFLGSSSQGAVYENYFDEHYPLASMNLATVFLQRMARMGRSVAGVFPAGWTFQSGATRLRNHLCDNNQIHFNFSLGDGAFNSSGAGEAVCLFAMSQQALVNEAFVFLSAEDARGPDAKSDFIKLSKPERCPQPVASPFILRPDQRTSSEALSKYARSYQGLKTGDLKRFVMNFWEVPTDGKRWICLRDSIGSKAGSGREKVLLWEGGKGRLHDYARTSRATLHDMHESGQRAWGHAGVLVNAMGDLRAEAYYGEHFLSNVSVLIPGNAELGATLAFCQSPSFARAVRSINPSRKVTNGSLIQVSFDLNQWHAEFSSNYPTGLPAPESSDPTQWLFHGHPVQADTGTHLHVALARLSGHRWPAENDPDILLSAKARDWVVKAGSLPMPDADGILPLAAVGSERPLADRLRDYLSVTIPGWDEAHLVREADERIDKKVGKDLSLEGWLRDRAFRQHSILFHNRPFLWQVWDGQKDGFSAFLHYHRLDHAALQKLTYTLLGAWITRREAEKDERRVEAAKVLKQKLEAILEGEAPHDIFLRWKPLTQQPIGWSPDLDDGVRMNIRPWVTAGVLREAAPKGIKWGVDSGTDLASAFWFKFDKGVRNNDRHTTLAEKQAARAAAAEKAAKA